MLYMAENTHQQSRLLGVTGQECHWDDMGIIFGLGVQRRGEDRF